ncbi:hypothetical protein LmNIHS28_00117 [Listeria monocytogenes]|nr:hypothetical protein F2382_00352 [Listeria monocytogenes]GAM94185.1 hypothetical protein LmNIHS28_00117 [Listeria monocytogenes]
MVFKTENPQYFTELIRLLYFASTLNQSSKSCIFSLILFFQVSFVPFKLRIVSNTSPTPSPPIAPGSPKELPTCPSTAVKLPETPTSTVEFTVIFLTSVYP